MIVQKLKTRAAVFSVLVATTSAILSASQNPVIFRYGGALEETVIGEQYFEISKLIALERDVSASNPGVQTVVINAYPYSSEMQLLLGRPPEVSYESWKEVYLLALSQLKDIKLKRLVRIGQNITVQSFDAGREWSEIVSGEDPTMTRIGNIGISLLEIQLIKERKLPSTTIERPPTCRLYVQASPFPSLSKAQEIAFRLARGLGVDTMTLLLRGDNWFIYSEGFPVFWPFSKPSPPPTKNDSMTSNEFDCQVNLRGAKCRGGRY